MYKDLEKRKKYLIEWRKRNRSRIRDKYRDYFKEYSKKHPKTYKYILGSRKYVRSSDYLTKGTVAQGRKYEKIALDLLPNSIDCNINTFSNPWDIEWNGLRIDVKSRIQSGGKTYRFSATPKSDYILAFCIDKNEKIEFTVFIPRNSFNKGFHISNKKKCKYAKYIVNIEFFARAVSTNNHESVYQQ